MLKPLEQWSCDTCNRIIEKPEDGRLEWIWSNGCASGFKIVHRSRRCAQYADHEFLADMDLDELRGVRGLIILKVLLDSGPWDAAAPAGIAVAAAKEFIEVVFRLHIAYYEEARPFLSAFKAEGMFGGPLEPGPSTSEGLKAIIEGNGGDPAPDTGLIGFGDSGLNS